MACGSPVVASRAGGLVEVVPEGEAGHLLPAGDVEGMADAATEVLSNEATWRRMSERAREVAVTRFSAERVVPVYEDFYQEVLTGRGATVGVSGADR